MGRGKLLFHMYGCLFEVVIPRPGESGRTALLEATPVALESPKVYFIPRASPHIGVFHRGLNRFPQTAIHRNLNAMSPLWLRSDISFPAPANTNAVTTTKTVFLLYHLHAKSFLKICFCGNSAKYLKKCRRSNFPPTHRTVPFIAQVLDFSPLMLRVVICGGNQLVFFVGQMVRVWFPQLFSLYQSCFGCWIKSRPVDIYRTLNVRFLSPLKPEKFNR